MPNATARPLAWLLLLAGLLGVGVSHAALGGLPGQFEPGSTVTVMPAADASNANYQLRETLLPAGTRVREYLGATGTVFAVSWEGPFLPDMKALLGRHFDHLVGQANQSPKAGKSRLSVHRPDIVIFSGGHMRAYTGRAWLPAELPPGFSPDEVR